MNRHECDNLYIRPTVARRDDATYANGFAENNGSRRQLDQDLAAGTMPTYAHIVPN
jgi:hypothetical protein